MNIKGSDKFNFFVPANLEKGKDKDGNEITWIDGIASSSSVKDSDNETLFPSGFDYAPLLESGFFNYNHKANVTSKAIVGQPTEAKIVNGGRDFYVKGFIYPNEEGKSIIDLAATLKKYSPDRKIGFSIEGTATSRDPFDSKKITGAVVTGIAITVQPKNKNTLMNIIKGDYSESFTKDIDETLVPGYVNEYNTWVGDDSHKGTEGSVKEFLENNHEDHLDLLPYLMDAVNNNIKKDMTVESVTPTMRESVEGASKDINNNKIAKEFGNFIKKSEIYTLIKSRYNSQIAETKQIFSLVEKTNKNLFSMINTETTQTEITAEALKKSFELLDEAIALVKGEEVIVLDTVTDVIVKSEEASAEDISKSVDTASILNKAGYSKEDACDIMVKGGIALNVAQGAWESVLASANAEKEGGKVTAVTAPIVKSEDAAVMATEIKKSLDPINQAIVKGFEGLGGLVKTLKDQNDLLVKSNEAFEERLAKFEGGSQGRKSVVTTTAIDRFEKGKEAGELKAGEEIINVDSKIDLAKLVTRLDAENENIVSKGKDPDALLIKAIETIEICNEVPVEAYARIRSMGIILQSAKAK